MKLKKLRIEGFRSLKDVTWEPGDLNVLIGPNGGGKSNLLAALKFIQQSVTRGLRDTTIAEGGWPGLVFGGVKGQLAWGLSAENTVNDLSTALDYHVKLSTLEQSGLFIRLDEAMTKQITVATGQVIAVSDALKTSGTYVILDDSLGPIELGPDTTLSDLALTGLGPYWTSFADIREFRYFLSKAEIINDFHTDRASNVRDETVLRPEISLSSDGSNLVAVLHSLYLLNEQFKNDLDEVMISAFGTEYDHLTFAPGSDQHVHLGISWKSLSKSVRSKYLSDGTLRFLLLATSLLNPEPPSFIAIDEPEVGLHPRMMSIVAAMIEIASVRTQVAVTTHSPQLLSAFRDTVPTVTVVSMEDGETQLNNVDGNDLRHWISNYTLGEVFTSGILTSLTSSVEKAA